MNRLLLSGKWILTNGKICVEGHVPGDITNDLYLAGVVQSPYYGENYKDCLWVTQEDWSYERNFLLEKLPDDENVYIRLEGVDTFAEVFLNGISIGITDNMHMEYRFPVKNYLKVGENVITVQMKNVYDRLGKEEQTKYDSIFCNNRIFIRKAQCHFGWDWAPQFPGYGIYRDISLVSEPAYALQTTNVTADIDGSVTFRLAFGEKFDGEIEVEIFDGENSVATAVRKVSCKKFLINLFVEDPKLWWPNGYGEQALYTYVVRMRKNGREENYTGSFGFRKIELERKPIDRDNISFGFKINGKKIFCRGSNWIPAECMTGTLTDEKYFTLLQAAKDANINMLRVWGGGIYEKDCFYDYCDRMGIMIWQDFMFACSEIPEDQKEFVDKITDEAVFQVQRLKNHPCLTYFCGENEIRGAFAPVEERYSVFTLHYLLRGITEELCPEIPYERTSPYCFADVENDVSEGDCHNNLSEVCLFDASFKGFDEFTYDEQKEWNCLRERIKNYERYIEGTISNFSSECAVLGICNYESLVKFAPEDALTLDSKFLEDRFLGNPYTYVMPTFFERQKKISAAMYGEAKNFKDFVKKMNKAQLDIMKTEIIYSRVNGRSNGFLNWMYNDIWPTGTWSVIDYYLSKKPVYYEMRRSFASLVSEIIRIGDKYYLCCINDGNTDISVQADIGLKEYSGKTLITKELTCTVKAGGFEKIEMPVETAKGDYLYAKGRMQDREFSTTYDLGRYRETSFVPEYSVKELERNGNRITVEITARTFVPCVKIYAGEKAELSDNYFDMDAGEIRIITIYGKEKDQELLYYSFIDEWDN